MSDQNDIVHIQRDIEHTRAQLDHTLSAIEQRLAPGQLFEDGIDYLRHHGAHEYMANLRESVKREPIPLALVGVGLAWMMMSGGRANGRAEGTSPRAGGELSAKAGDAADALRGKASAASSTVSHLAEQTSNKVSDLAEDARARARLAGETMRHGAARVRSGYEHLVEEQPLALGAIGFALGVVLASAAPRSRAEDRLLGHTSDRLKDDIGQFGREQANRVAGAAAAAVDDIAKATTAEPSQAHASDRSGGAAPVSQTDPQGVDSARQDAQPEDRS